MEITFDIQKDFRQFKEGTKYTINPQFGKILYMTGKNRVGKSTLLQVLRSKQDSLKNMNKNIYDGMTDDRIEMAGLEPCEVTGYDYDETFFLDSIIDDPVSMINSASAYAYVNGGGLASQHESKGEKALIMMYKFNKKIEQYLINKYGSIENWKNASKRCLIVLDEVDEGFDINLQMNWNNIIVNTIISKFGADVIIVTHNPLCMLSPLNDTWSDIIQVEVYNMNTNKTSNVSDYVSDATGYSINIEPVVQI